LWNDPALLKPSAAIGLWSYAPKKPSAARILTKVKTPHIVAGLQKMSSDAHQR